MIIKAYIRLQHCTSNTRRAFVSRRQREHGIAKGQVRYYAVEGSSWAQIRKTLKTFEIMGHSNCRPETVCGYSKDIGTGIARLHPLLSKEVPAVALWENVKDRVTTPELTSFGVSAVERIG